MTPRRAISGGGGPVGSGKTALLDRLCKRLRDRYSLAVITNDICTYEDAEFLMRSGALPLERLRGVRTGGVPAHGDSRRYVDQPGSGGRDARGVPRRTAALPGIRRRQSRGVVQSRARR